MFVRRKTNPSGSISITVVDKSRGRYEVVRSFGSTRSVEEADLLENLAREFVRAQAGNPENLFGRMDDAQLRSYVATLPEGRIELCGPELVFGTLFDRLGLGGGHESLFRHMVVCRLYNPGGKKRVAGYLQRYLGSIPSDKEIFAAVDSLRLPDLRVSPLPARHCKVMSSQLPRTAFCLLMSADRRPVAGRLVERRFLNDSFFARLARQYGDSSPLTVERRGPEVKEYAAFFRITPSDLSAKPQLRRRRGRVEGHLCICLAALAIQLELERLLDEAGADVSLAQVREAVRTMRRVNYVSPYTSRPKSVLLPMDPTQKKLFSLLFSE